ncbi:MAG: hypothetical protein HQ580_16455 [Planctomycetes bacterium]|nr:hypothetical protein [Planctomycetota bacterium]
MSGISARYEPPTGVVVGSKTSPAMKTWGGCVIARGPTTMAVGIATISLMRAKQM